MGKQESLVPALSAELHSQAIQGAMARSIEGFIQVGQKVMEAKADLTDEDFGTLFDKSSKNYVGMAERQGYRFLSIAKGEKKLLQFQDSIPADVTQLDAISRMNVKDIKAAIKADVMTPSMNRGDLAKWERSLQAPEVDPGQAELDYTNDNEVVDIESTPVPEKTEPESVTVSLYDATLVVIEATPEADRLRVVKGLMKKWKISLEDLA